MRLHKNFFSSPARWLCLWASIGMPFNQAFAERMPEIQKIESERVHNRAEEYFSEEIPGELLISIHLIGAVNRSGVYHVPRNTDVIHLISLAGGTRADANLERITIKRRNKAVEEVIECDLKETAEEPGKYAPVLQAGDMVLVYAKEPFIDPNTVAALSLITTILSIAVSATVIIRSIN